MPRLASEVVKSRAERLRRAAAARHQQWLDTLLGSSQTVLVENDGKGHSDSFAPVRIEHAARGDIGVARITGRNGDVLEAVWA